MSGIEIASVVVSVVSVIVAFLAIYLSITFYKMSTRTFEDVRQKTDLIESSVDKLEMISNALLSKMFGMIDKTLVDYQKHAWPGEASEEDFSRLAEEKADERIEKIRKEMSEEMEAKISEISRKTKETDVQISEIKASMEELLGKAITETRHVEKDTELMRMKNMILITLLYLWRRKDKEVYIGRLRRVWGELFVSDMGKALCELKTERLIVGIRKGWIRLTPKGIETAKEIESRIDLTWAM